MMILDDIYSRYIQELQNIDTIVSMINHKAAVNCDCEKKIEVITEILQDIKLVLTPVDGNEVH